LRIGRKYRYRTAPRPHQVRAIRKALRAFNKGRPGFALFMPMRSGKTKVAIDLIEILAIKYKVRRVLVICGLSQFGVWKNEIRKHGQEGSQVEWAVVNYQKTYSRIPDPAQPDNPRAWIPGDNPDLLEYQAHVVVVDESHRIGNPTTLQSRKTWKIGSQAKFRLILTGTPWHRRPVFIFGQFKFLDEKILGTSWKDFKLRIARWSGPGDSVLVRYYQPRIEKLAKTVKRHAFILKRVPHVPPVHQVIPVELAKSRKKYDAMAEDAIVQLGSDEISATNVLTVILRLRQMCLGWVRQRKGEKYHHVGSEKRKAFEDWINDRRDEGLDKLVVGSPFLPGVREAATACLGAGYRPILFHGGLDPDERERRIADFDESRDVAFIAQSATGSEGIDLSSASVLVWYAPPVSLIEHDQFNARIENLFDAKKKSRTLAYYYFICKDSIEETMMLSLQAKKELASILLKHPDWVIGPGKD
jgi:SNF2 family DNA or RNA helicase